MKKIIAVFLCLTFIFLFFCSCKRETQPTDETTTAFDEEQETTTTQAIVSKTVTIGYYSHKSLNPYKTNSAVNNNISKLLYDSLFKLDNEYNLVTAIAQEYERDGKNIFVTLKEGVLFSDGSKLSADDVVYSFTLAKKSSLYKARLSLFTSAYSKDGGVMFTLSSEDIYAVNCLDFPIIQAGQENANLPIGSGRYVAKKKSGSYTLSRNENYSLDEQLEQETIKLYDINETQTPLYLLQIGELSFVYDDLSNSKEKYKINANTAAVNLNNLVFLSFNSENALFKDSNIKNAISKAIDINSLCGVCYDSMARPCTNAFNPSWSAVSSLAEKDISQDTLKAAALLEESGYVFEYSTNKYRSKNFEFLKLNLIVNKEDSRRTSLASQIKKSLNAVGIDLTVENLSFSDYKERLEKGEFDMYIGEIKLTQNMSLRPFFKKGGNANYGIDTKSTACDAYYDFVSGKIDISTFVKVFDEYKPFIPICYRSGIIYYSRELKYEGSASESDVFSNIYSWSF